MQVNVRKGSIKGTFVLELVAIYEQDQALLRLMNGSSIQYLVEKTDKGTMTVLLRVEPGADDK